MNKVRIAAFAALILFPLAGFAADKKSPPPEVKTLLAAQGEKNMLPGGGWFAWKFTGKPKLGTVIVRVELFGKDGKPAKDLEFVGESGMPAMRYHDSGPVKFQLNKKGYYLLPVDVVMAGEWQLVIRVKKAKKEIYAGKVLFSV